jgi:hypothetical protein
MNRTKRKNARDAAGASSAGAADRAPSEPIPETLPEDFSDWEGVTFEEGPRVTEAAVVARAAVTAAKAARAAVAADSDLEAFLRRLSEVNTDLAPSSQVDPSIRVGPTLSEDEFNEFLRRLKTHSQEPVKAESAEHSRKTLSFFENGTIFIATAAGVAGLVGKFANSMNGWLFLALGALCFSSALLWLINMNYMNGRR